MTEKQFRKNIKLLFDEFDELSDSDNKLPNLIRYYLNPGHQYTINIYPKLMDYWIYLYQTSRVYESPSYQSYEQFYDELIIFKELMLPKYQ